MLYLEDISREIIGSALRIHQALGPGLFESVYVTILGDDAARNGFAVEREKPISLEFGGQDFLQSVLRRLIHSGLRVGGVQIELLDHIVGY